MPRPTSPDKEWVELYNNSPSNIDLTQWIITELTSTGNVNPHNLPSVIIPSHASCFYEFGNPVLNDNGDTISLNDSGGTQIDSYTYTATTPNKTFSRIPNGGAWQASTDPSKSSTDCNSLSPPATPTSTPTPTTSNPSPVFSISGVPSQTDSNQSFNTQITLTLPSSPNTIYYLTGAFKKSGGTRYFGLTKKDSGWIQYGDDYLNKVKITTNAEGSWSSSIEVKPDTDDTDYKGSGDYIFKIGRYSSTGSGPTWSNEVTIKINEPENTPSNSPTPTATPKTAPASSSVSANLKAPTAKPSTTPSPKESNLTASVAGAEASPPEEIKKEKTKSTNPFLWIGIIFIFAGTSLIGYIYLKRHAKIRNKL